MSGSLKKLPSIEKKEELEIEINNLAHEIINKVNNSPSIKCSKLNAILQIIFQIIFSITVCGYVLLINILDNILFIYCFFPFRCKKM